MTCWKALIILQASHVRLIFHAGTFIEYHCPREKVLRHSQPNRWLVPRGHECSPSMLSWFMISVLCLCWDDYAGSSLGPKHHHKGYWRWSTTPHGHMDKLWTDEFLTAALWIQDQSLQYIWSAELNLAQMLSLSLTQVSNLRLSLAFTQHSGWTWLALAKGLCAGPLGREGNRYRIDSPSFPDPPRLCHVKSFSLPCMCLLGLQSYC